MSMSTRILTLYKRATEQIRPTLGRWTNHTEKETSLKIKFANEDNCGVSGNKPDIKKRLR